MSTAEESAVSPEVAIEYVVATGTPSAVPVCMSTIVYEGLRVKRSPSTHMTTLSIARRSVGASSIFGKVFVRPATWYSDYAHATLCV